MDVEFHIKEDMRALGCNSDLKIALAFNLYVHLVDEKLMYDTEYCYNKDIDTLYIIARPNRDENPNIYIPIPTSDMISMEFINRMQENLCTVETGATINLAFTAGDFTTVIYSFTKGLVDRPSAERVEQQRAKAARRSFIENELRINENDILNDALNGGAVDDEDCQILE